MLRHRENRGKGTAIKTALSYVKREIWGSFAMKPQDAAKLFESMIPDREDVVIRILENLTPEGRAAILSNMSITNAADLTEKMKQ